MTGTVPVARRDLKKAVDEISAACRLKQRKRRSSVAGFLERLGVPALEAGRLAGSGQGLWHSPTR